MFDDIDKTQKDEWWFEAVQYVYTHNIMIGNGTSFKPYDKLAREQLIQSLYSYSGKPEIANKASFKDVKADEWYTDAIAWAKQQGLTSGNGDETFGVGQAITREAFAVILYRFADINGYDTDISSEEKKKIENYADYDNISDWSVEALAWAISKGIMTGKGNGNDVSTYKIDPQGYATRAEAAVMLTKLIETKSQNN